MLKQDPALWYRDTDECVGLEGKGQLVARIIRVIEQLCLWVAIAAAICCAALAVLTSVLVVLGIFNWTHNGLEELKWHICGSIFMLSGAYCLQRNAHVRVDTFYAKFSPRSKAIIDILGIVFLLWPFAAMVVYHGIDMSYDAFVRSEASNDAGGLSYRFLIKSTIPLGFALLLLQSVAVVLRAGLSCCGCFDGSVKDQGSHDA